MTEIDNMCQEQKEKDSAVLKVAWMQQFEKLENYIKKSKERLITAIRNSTDNITINRTTITRKQKWEEKTTVRIFQAKNWQNLIWEDLDMAKKRNP